MAQESISALQNPQVEKGWKHHLVQRGNKIKDVLDDMVYDTEINDDLQSLATSLIDLKKHYKTIGIEAALAHGKKTPEAMYQAFIDTYDFIEQYDVKNIETLKTEYNTAYMTNDNRDSERLADKQVKCLYNGTGFITGEMRTLQERDLHKATLKQLRQEARDTKQHTFTDAEIMTMQAFLEQIVAQIPVIDRYIKTIKEIGSPKTQKILQQVLENAN